MFAFYQSLSIVRAGLKSTHRWFSVALDNNIKKSVLISQSTDIFTNLALEDWLYKNFDFTKHYLLLLWQNQPCVVIGRHQNPWLEANVSELNSITDNGVKLARRNSGGGTVYHDDGNINMTFFTPRNKYNRRHNLEIITEAVMKEYGVQLEITKKEDLTLRDFKVSGTASKLGRTTAYHHCTLLVNVNKINLSRALHKEDVNIETNATKSIKSPIINLLEEKPEINIDALFKAIGCEYLQTAPSMINSELEATNFEAINPTEQCYPGISEIKNHLMSWEWCFGKTPKFTISRSFIIPESLTGDSTTNLQVTMEVENGLIRDIKSSVPNQLSEIGFNSNINAITNLVGCKFSDDAVYKLEHSIEGIVNVKERFITNCVRQMISSL